VRVSQLDQFLFVIVGQSQVVLDTPVAIGIVVAIVTPLAGTVAKLYTNLVTSYENQLVERDARITDLKEQLERSNKLADESSAALRESIREGHRALTVAQTQAER
jgi:hypothetical protein